MTGNPVQRCVAVASHGKRCQRTPYKGSPYCWHHLHSRKVYAPSRPPADRRTTEVVVVGRTDRRRVVAPSPLAERATSSGARLARYLGPRRVAMLLAFLESQEDGAFVLSRRDGVIDGGEVERAASDSPGLPG